MLGSQIVGLGFIRGRLCAAGEAVKTKASDYKIEIGTVHVSGVSCLVKETKFQRGSQPVLAGASSLA